MKKTKKAKVIYTGVDNKPHQATLRDFSWSLLRGVEVLRGKQLINGQLVRRSLATDEITKFRPIA